MSEFYGIVAKVDCRCSVDNENALVKNDIVVSSSLTEVIEKAIDMCNNYCVCVNEKYPRTEYRTLKFKPDVVRVYQINNYAKGELDIKKDFKYYLEHGFGEEASYREIWSWMLGRVTDVKKHMNYSGIRSCSGGLMTERPKDSPPNSGIQTVSGLRVAIWQKSQERETVENLRKENLELRIMLSL